MASGCWNGPCHCKSRPWQFTRRVDARAAVARAVLSQPLAVDTHGQRFHVEWDPHASVTPLGQLVFFSQFLATAGLFRDWVQTCPLSFTSPNALLLPDLLGTMTLAILAGQNRYAHVTALRADTVNPQGLGMSKVCSEDIGAVATIGGDLAGAGGWKRRRRRAARSQRVPAGSSGSIHSAERRLNCHF